MPIQQSTNGHQMQDSDMTRCISNCMNTQRACLEAINHCLEEFGTAHSGEHIKLMQTCVETCNLSIRLMSLDSDFHQQACELCFEVCTACAEACERYEDNEVMKRCAQACRQSAASCRGMAGMTVKVKTGKEQSSHSRM